MSEARSLERHFRIVSHDTDWVAGVAKDGRQVLAMPFTETSIVILYFDPEGRYLEAEEREVGREAIWTANQPSWIIDLNRDAGLRATPIFVRKFEVAEYGIAIDERPEEYEEFLADPERVEPDIKHRNWTHENAREWDREKRFVLYTGDKAYWMNGDGSVYAT